VQQPGRDVGRRMVVARSNCSRAAVESKSSRSYHRTSRITTTTTTILHYFRCF